MELGCASIITEVGDLVGRDPNTDSLITSARIMRWLNEAQTEIIQRTPGLLQLTNRNTGSLDFSSGTSRYSIGDITNQAIDTTESGLCHVFNVWYLDGNNSNRLSFVHTDEFDNQFFDITHSDFPAGKPKWWTRRGTYIETYPRCATSYEGYPLAAAGTWYARDFSAVDTTRASDISTVDKGLIYYAVAEAWGAIGNEAKAAIWKLKFSNNSEEGGWYEKWRNNQCIVYAWDGNWYSDNLV